MMSSAKRLKGRSPCRLRAWGLGQDVDPGKGPAGCRSCQRTGRIGILPHASSLLVKVEQHAVEVKRRVVLQEDGTREQQIRWAVVGVLPLEVPQQANGG